MNLQNSAYNKNETQGFNVEATFKGQKALTFMKGMGYEFNGGRYGEVDNANSKGHIFSVANGIAAFGPMGVMVDMGGVFDSHGNSKLYFTLGWAQGMGYGGGMAYGTTNKDFRLEDINGWSSGWMVNIAWFNYEHFGDFQHGAIKDYTGRNMTYNGGGLGTFGLGGFHYFSYTVTVDPPSGEQIFRMVMHWH